MCRGVFKAELRVPIPGALVDRVNEQGADPDQLAGLQDTGHRIQQQRASDMPALMANIDGFWNPLLALLAHMKDTAFIRANLSVDILTADRVEDILPRLEKAAADLPEATKLMEAGVANKL